MNTEEAVFGQLRRVLSGFLFPALAFAGVRSVAWSAGISRPPRQADGAAGSEHRTGALWAKLAALGWAQEDSRVVLPLATHTQEGGIPQQTLELAGAVHTCSSSLWKAEVRLSRSTLATQ